MLIVILIGCKPQLHMLLAHNIQHMQHLLVVVLGFVSRVSLTM